jgi:uncharacterized phosphosugar-binding protein
LFLFITQPNILKKVKANAAMEKSLGDFSDIILDTGAPMGDSMIYYFTD